MGIEFDRDGSSDHSDFEECLNGVRDPFSYKVELAEIRRFRLLQKIRTYSGRNSSASKSTAMAQLVLQATFEFTDTQMMKFLGLNPESNVHTHLYDLIVGLVIYTVRRLRAAVTTLSLMQFPLTDLQDICYRIADCFDSLFFIPVTRLDRGSDVRESFVWEDRFNGLWPIMYLLRREYNYCDAE